MLIAAPHTSNWDLPYTLMVAFCLRLRIRFYFIALQAQVPIVLAYIDYPRKVGGLGPVFVPTGDVDKDMAEIKRFYAGIRGRNEGQFSAD